MAQLQKVLRLLWKNCPGVCCKQGRQHSTAVLLGAATRCHGMDGLRAQAAHGDAILKRNLPDVTCGSQSSVMCACLFTGSAHCSRRRKMHRRLIVFLSLEFVKYVVGPVLVSLCFIPFPHCSVSLLISPFQTGQLHDEEVL